jgi:lipopolysaccharide/colanic/teichoic acid biosynthesis glycosyltransferase
MNFSLLFHRTNDEKKSSIFRSKWFKPVVIASSIILVIIIVLVIALPIALTSKSNTSTTTQTTTGRQKPTRIFQYRVFQKKLTPFCNIISAPLEFTF